MVPGTSTSRQNLSFKKYVVPFIFFFFLSLTRNAIIVDLECYCLASYGVTNLKPETLQYTLKRKEEKNSNIP